MLTQPPPKKAKTGDPVESEPMNSTHVSYLPTEMLSEIVNWVVCLPGKPCLRNLSLASSTLRALAQPLLLREINMGTCAVQSISSIEDQIKELSTGNCLASKHARTLVIDYSGGFQTKKSRLEDPPLMPHLEQAILSFKNVEKIIWYPRDREWPLMHQSIGRALMELAPKQISIEWLDFEAEIFGVFDADTFETLTEVLKNLIQGSPLVTHLDLNIPNMELFSLEYFPDMLDTSLSHLKHLGLASSYLTFDQFDSILYHLPNLQSLSFHDTGPKDNLRYEEQDTRAPIWEFLEERKINLSRISTNTSNDVDDLLSYLASYHGIEHLELDVLKPAPTSTPLHPFKLLAILATNHRQSLLNLSIRACNGQTTWMWQNFTEDMNALIFHFPKLRCLELTARGVSKANITSLLTYCDRCLPALEQLILDGPWSKGNQCHGKFAPECPFCDYEPCSLINEPLTYELDLIPRFNHHSYLPSEIDAENKQAIRAITTYNGKRVFGTPPFSIILGRLLFLRRTLSKNRNWRYVNVEL